MDGLDMMFILYRVRETEAMALIQNHIILFGLNFNKSLQLLLNVRN